MPREDEKALISAVVFVVLVLFMLLSASVDGLNIGETDENNAENIPVSSEQLRMGD